MTNLGTTAVVERLVASEFWASLPQKRNKILTLPPVALIREPPVDPGTPPPLTHLPHEQTVAQLAEHQVEHDHQRHR